MLKIVFGEGNLTPAQAIKILQAIPDLVPASAKTKAKAIEFNGPLNTEKEPGNKPATEPAAPAVKSGKLDYNKDVRPQALKLAKTNEAALRKIYADFGVNVGTELKPEQWAGALKAINEALG